MQLHRTVMGSSLRVEQILCFAVYVRAIVSSHQCVIFQALDLCRYALAKRPKCGILHSTFSIGCSCAAAIPKMSHSSDDSSRSYRGIATGILQFTAQISLLVDYKSRSLQYFIDAPCDEPSATASPLAGCPCTTSRFSYLESMSHRVPGIRITVTISNIHEDL